MIAAEVKYKTTGIDWIPEVPEHWKLWKVSRAFKTIGSGTTPQSGNLSYYENGTINWVCTGDLNDDLVETTEHKVTKAAFEKHSALKLFPKGTLLIAMYGATIGKTGIINFDACTNQACCALGDSDVLLTKFVYYWFFVNRPNIVRLSYGGGQPNISQDVIKRLRIQTPPIEEQEQIVTYLDTQSAKITRFIQTKQRFIELLKEQRQSIITNAVTKGIDDGLKMKETGIEWMGLVPEHWKVSRLKFIGESFIGLTYSPTEIVDKEKGILVLRSSNIQNGRLSMLDNVYVRKDVPEKLKTRKGDILLCSRNGSAELIGKNILIDEESEGQTFGAFMTIFRSPINKYLYYFFNSNIFLSQTALFGTSTINQLTNDILKNLVVAFPKDDEEQNKIIEYIKTETRTLDIAISKAEREIELIKEYREAMIAEAVTGKIKL